MSYVSCKPIALSEQERRYLDLEQENRNLREEYVTIAKAFRAIFADLRILISGRRNK